MTEKEKAAFNHGVAMVLSDISRYIDGDSVACEYLLEHKLNLKHFLALPDLADYDVQLLKEAAMQHSSCEAMFFEGHEDQKPEDQS